MSEVKVNKITPRTNCGTTTLGDSGDTINIPAGVTISNNGTATGFGATGAVNWDVASIKTSDFSAVNGSGYFVNTSGGAVIATFPASPTAGDVIGFCDYANSFDTYSLTLNRNGSNIEGAAANGSVNIEGASVTLVYVDATKGWIVTDSGNSTDYYQETYISGSGGCITTSGNYKIHTFNSPGTFTVGSISNSAANNVVSYMVVGGGGGGGGGHGGAGGAGGFREYKSSVDCYTASPLDGNPGGTAITVTATPYPITVGGAAASGTGYVNPGSIGTSGNSSTFSTITSAGGGGGGGYNVPGCAPSGEGGQAGGSGGGAVGQRTRCGGTGNSPPTTPAQGTAGGNTNSPGGGGGGGAEAGPGTSPAGPPYTGGAGGAGGGGAVGGGQPTATPGTNGTANTGGGGGGGTGGGSPGGPPCGGQGGSGIVVIRYKYQ